MSNENIELESIQNRSPDCNLSPPPELLGKYFKEDSDEAENTELELISNASLEETLPSSCELFGEDYEDVSSASSWEYPTKVNQSEL